MFYAALRKGANHPNLRDWYRRRATQKVQVEGHTHCFFLFLVLPFNKFSFPSLLLLPPPPQVINKAGHGKAVDWWGLGMLMYEMLTGLPPWYTKDRQKLFERLRAAPLVIPKNISAPSASIIGGLLTRNPSKRLGTTGALQVWIFL